MTFFFLHNYMFLGEKNRILLEMLFVWKNQVFQSKNIKYKKSSPLFGKKNEVVLPSKTSQRVYQLRSACCRKKKKKIKKLEASVRSAACRCQCEREQRVNVSCSGRPGCQTFAALSLSLGLAHTHASRLDVSL